MGDKRKQHDVRTTSSLLNTLCLRPYQDLSGATIGTGATQLLLRAVIISAAHRTAEIYAQSNMQVTQILCGNAPLCKTHSRSRPHSVPQPQRLCARVSGNALSFSPAAAYEARQRLQLAAASATLDDLSASTAGSKEDEAQPSSAPASGSSKVDDVPLTSEVW
jgi:hypothetical protein